MSKHSGGCVIVRPEPIPYKIGKSVGITLMSDLHIGASNVRVKLIDRELHRARLFGDRININGDLLDLILAKDAKRYAPSALHPRLRGRNDLVNAAVDWAVEILAPYADLIDMIGVGNHEAAVEHFHSVDPTRMIIDKLNDKLAAEEYKHRVNYGGYSGFIDYRFRRQRQESEERSGRDAVRWQIFYHHGSGKGSSPITKGVGDFTRLDMMIDADLMWLGHNHQRTSDSTQRISCPLVGDKLRTYEIRHVRTGAYMDVYSSQTQESIRKKGRQGNYAADAMVAAGGMGGARVELTFTGDCRQPFDLRVTQ